MRPIKFRAWLKEWDEKGGKMFYKVLPLGGWDRWWAVLGEDESGYDGEWKVGEDIEVMQFTGLHDKNGKEIYEGDVVQKHGTPKEQFIVGFEEGELEGGCPSYFGFQEVRGEASEWKVIGNIYENPELIPTPK